MRTDKWLTNVVDLNINIPGREKSRMKRCTCNLPEEWFLRRCKFISQLLILSSVDDIPNKRVDESTSCSAFVSAFCRSMDLRSLMQKQNALQRRMQPRSCSWAPFFRPRGLGSRLSPRPRSQRAVACLPRHGILLPQFKNRRRMVPATIQRMETISKLHLWMAKQYHVDNNEETHWTRNNKLLLI